MEKQLFIYPGGGLANRLINIYWGLYWQERLKCKMEILWEVELACGIKFEKLFISPQDVRVKTIYTMPISYEITVRSAIGKMYRKWAKNKQIHFSSEEIINQLYDDGMELAINRLADYTAINGIKPDEPLADWQYISKMAGQLKPVAEIADRVDEIMGKYEDSSTVGIHIRRTDNVRSIENSPLSVFTEQMRTIIKENPATRFYLATDDESVEEQFSREFPLIRHATFSTEKSRETEAGMMDAYVDMLCLSRCNRIYGSYLSTFSRMAAVIGKKDCIILKK